MIKVEPKAALGLMGVPAGVHPWESVSVGASSHDVLRVPRRQAKSAQPETVLLDTKLGSSSRKSVERAAWATWESGEQLPNKGTLMVME